MTWPPNVQWFPCGRFLVFLFVANNQRVRWMSQNEWHGSHMGSVNWWTNLLWYSDGAFTRESRNVHQCLNFLSFFQVKKSKFGRGSTFLVRSGGLPQPLDLTLVNLWKLCELLHQTLPTKTPAAGGSNSLNWKTSQETSWWWKWWWSALGWTDPKEESFSKRGDVGDGGRIAGQSSNPSLQASLPSSSLNRWPPPQMTVQCTVV